MKNILTTILVLFTLVVNAQDRDTFTICNGVKVYTYCDTLVKYVSIESESALFKQGSLSELNGVWFSINKSDSINRLFLDEGINYLDFTEELLDTLSMRWCGKLFESTPTGLKQDTIYDYGTRTPKEVDSLEETGYVVIESPWAGTLSFLGVTYDTIEVEGLAFYISNEDFKKGKVFELLPTTKTVVRCRNCFTQTYHYNGFKFTADNTLSVRQLHQIPNSNLWIKQDGSYLYEWQEVDLTKYKEFIFIEKPK